MRDMSVHGAQRARAYTRRGFLGVGGGLAAGLALAGCGGVQGGRQGATDGYPTRPVQLVAPFAAGGSTDLSSRALARGLTDALGRSVVVVNQPGANGAVGGKQVISGPPDGYSLVTLAGSLFALTPLLVKDPDTLSLDEMTIVSGITSEEVVLLVKADSPYQSVQDVLARRGTGTPITYATSGRGGASGFAQGLLFAAAGVPASEVPFGGGNPAVTALVGGQVDIAASHPGESITQVRSGQLRHLGVFSAQRSAQLPDVPTLVEQGFDIVVDRNAFVAGPPGLPDEIQQTLRQAFAESVKRPEYADFLEQNLIVSWEQDGPQVKDKLLGDRARYQAMIEKFGARFDGAP
jgi:tripartite-type tricarboxylate transporter receptor subunit TctC